MSSSVVVRDATPSDVEIIVDFNCQLASETEDKILDRSLIARGVSGGLARPELCRYFVAEVDGHPAGTTMVTYELTDWRDGVIWWLQSVYVDQEFRRRGVFRALYDHIAGLARSTPEARGLRLYVKEDNARAQQTYQSMGMHSSGYLVFEHDWSQEGRDT